MDIGIIGAGHIGGSLTRRLAGLGHAVRVSNSRAPETLADLAVETGATAVWAREAATDADLVIVSIPQKNVIDLAPGIVARRSRARRSSRPITTTRASATA
ncbi:MAG TPA: NAD(P)-binding domain-containing protein [Solirubrobacteraceae bacterium]|nr:NAD(P)-binding domain-containing protein [Solirubrobacteraceae bacterium]